MRSKNSSLESLLFYWAQMVLVKQDLASKLKN